MKRYCSPLLHYLDMMMEPKTSARRLAGHHAHMHPSNSRQCAQQRYFGLAYLVVIHAVGHSFQAGRHHDQPLDCFDAILQAGCNHLQQPIVAQSLLHQDSVHRLMVGSWVLLLQLVHIEGSCNLRQHLPLSGAGAAHNPCKLRW